MFTIETILGILVPPSIGYLIFNEKRAANMMDKINKRTTQRDVEHLIDVHHWVTELEIKGLKEDVREMKDEHNADMAELRAALRDINNKL